MPTLTDTEVRVDVDITLEVACEGEAHPDGTNGHDGGPARWRLICPICGWVILQCEGRTVKLRSSVVVLCAECSSLVPAEKYGFFLL